MAKRMIPRSMKKFIRKEKARIRKTVADTAELKRLIATLYAPFSRSK